ncbi:DUF4123 domain-containing protein [Rhodovulum sp. YEN HP10]|uniref:DUF4123 domain-containing protein n=1 Tax=Rhodovulum sp. HP10 TaxID=3387397 RepID=UPI0039E18A4B
MSRTSLISRGDLQRHLAASGSTFALLDAARLPGLVDRLEGRGYEPLCLFQGAAAETLADAAPYLVRLEGDSDLLRHFLDDGDLYWAMWRKRPGILIETGMTAGALRKHLRRFLRVSIDGTAFFFRFWEPAAAASYFQALTSPARRAPWFFPRETGQIEAFLIPDPRRDGLKVEDMGPVSRADVPSPRPAFTLDAAELAAIRGARVEDDLIEMERLMAETFPAETGALAIEDLRRGLRRSVGRAREFGIRQKRNAFRLAAWDLHCAGPFERTDPTGELRRILEMPHPEADKMRRLTDQIGLIEGKA